MTLIDKAHAAPRGDQRNYSNELVDAVEVLRGKGWGFRAIHKWMSDQEEDVHPNWVTFASAMCQRIQHRRNKNTQ
ncbi:MAG: hypothetical protein EBR82_11665 [Caulobacteraceae bacterium]|nr:hypothetical protein [Caulobacteraceae bacterium]